MQRQTSENVSLPTASAPPGRKCKAKSLVSVRHFPPPPSCERQQSRALDGSACLVSLGSDRLRSSTKHLRNESLLKRLCDRQPQHRGRSGVEHKQATATLMRKGPERTVYRSEGFQAKACGSHFHRASPVASMSTAGPSIRWHNGTALKFPVLPQIWAHLENRCFTCHESPRMVGARCQFAPRWTAACRAISDAGRTSEGFSAAW